MRKIFLFTALVISLNSFAQDSTLVEQYCEVVATPRLLSNRVTIDVDYGEQRSIWKDNRLKDEEGKLKKFNTTVDALNYLGKMGWKMVNAFPVYNGSSNTLVYHYMFRKEFLKTDTEGQ